MGLKVVLPGMFGTHAGRALDDDHGAASERVRRRIFNALSIYTITSRSPPLDRSGPPIQCSNNSTPQPTRNSYISRPRLTVPSTATQPRRAAKPPTTSKMASTTPQPPYSPSPSSHLRTSSIPTAFPSPAPAHGGASSNSSNTTSGFSYPPHYNFPPFFTLQPVLSTRTSQLASWSAFIQSYCRHQRRFVLSLVDALDSDLFWNRRINKRLSAQDARAVIAYMASAEGGYRAEWVDGADASGGGGAAALVGGLGGAGARGTADGNASGRVWIYWRRPEEWAGVLEGWVSGNTGLFWDRCVCTRR